ncbi:MAG: hypothetical protein JRJ59_11450 [Deltaproteobacteria bacterium]|nr:hypothetical protein [Deltaproteobacteria bacterium]
MADQLDQWPDEEEIKARELAAWQALSAQDKLDFLERFVSGLLAARQKSPLKGGDDEPNQE